MKLFPLSHQMERKFKLRLKEICMRRKYFWICQRISAGDFQGRVNEANILKAPGINSCL